MNQLNEILVSKNRIAGIYKITSPTGKIYIGQSWNMKKRWQVYKYLDCSDQPKLYNSLKKHGSINHCFEIVCYLPNDCSQTVMNDYETIYWSQYRDLGFHMLNLKEPGSYGKHLPETVEKLKQRRHTDQTKILLREMKLGDKNAMFGRKGILSPSTYRTKEKNPNYGKSFTDEHRNKMSISTKRYYENNNHPSLGIPLKQSTKDKIGKANSGEKSHWFGKTGSRSIRSVPVIQKDRQGIIIKTWVSATIAANELNVSRKHISACCREKRKTAGGFTWSYT